MKKLKKMDTKLAQSVISFACPCIDTCQNCLCGCGGPEVQRGLEGAKAAISTWTIHGLLAANYA